jgi:hypothetical protein
MASRIEAGFFGIPPPPDLLESWGYSHTTLKIFEE